MESPFSRYRRDKNIVEVAWQSYDFHYEIMEKLQKSNDEVINQYNQFLDNNLNPSKRSISVMRKKANDSFDALIMGYEKFMSVLDDLIAIYKSKTKIPPEREIKIEFLYQYKNVTATQYAVAQKEQQMINEVLN